MVIIITYKGDLSVSKYKKHIIIAMLIVVSIATVLLRVNYFGYARVLSLNWGLRLPSGYTQVYEKDTGASPHGDGIRYHIFEYKNTDKIENSVSWKEETTYLEIATELLNTLEVPDSQRADFKHCLCYYIKENDHSELIMFYEQDTGKVYIIEFLL